jgi:hypothetical protein
MHPCPSCAIPDHQTSKSVLGSAGIVGLVVVRGEVTVAASSMGIGTAWAMGRASILRRAESRTGMVGSTTLRA